MPEVSPAFSITDATVKSASSASLAARSRMTGTSVSACTAGSAVTVSS